GDTGDGAGDLGAVDAEAVPLGDGAGVATGPLPQRVEAPEGAREGVGGAVGPERGDRVEALGVDEVDEAVDELGVVGAGAAAVDDGAGGGVGGLGADGGVDVAHDLLGLLGGEHRRAAEASFGHGALLPVGAWWWRRRALSRTCGTPHDTSAGSPRACRRGRGGRCRSAPSSPRPWRGGTRRGRRRRAWRRSGSAPGSAPRRRPRSRGGGRRRAGAGGGRRRWARRRRSRRRRRWRC